MPGDHIAAVGKTGDGRVGLVLVGLGVDQGLGSLGNTAGIVELAADIPARPTIMTAVVPPGNEEAAVLEAGHFRTVLVATRPGIDLELFAEGLAAGAIPLSKDTVIVAILAIGFPSHHIAAVGQPSHGRLLLMALNIGIDLELFAVFRRKRDFGSVAEAHALDISQRIRTPVAVRGIGVRDLAVSYVDPVIARITVEDRHVVTVTAIKHIVTKTSGKRIVAGLTLQMIGAVTARQNIAADTADQVVIAIFAINRRANRCRSRGDNSSAKRLLCGTCATQGHGLDCIVADCPGIGCDYREIEGRTVIRR